MLISARPPPCANTAASSRQLAGIVGARGPPRRVADVAPASAEPPTSPASNASIRAPRRPIDRQLGPLLGLSRSDLPEGGGSSTVRVRIMASANLASRSFGVLASNVDVVVRPHVSPVPSPYSPRPRRRFGLSRRSPWPTYASDVRKLRRWCRACRCGCASNSIVARHGRLWSAPSSPASARRSYVPNPAPPASTFGSTSCRDRPAVAHSVRCRDGCRRPR